MDHLSRLPDPIFVKIFNQFESNKLLELRLVSRQLKRLIHRNIVYLNRPKIERIDFQLRYVGIKRRLFRIKLRQSSRKPSKCRDLELHTNEADQNILPLIRDSVSQFRLTNSITFSGCKIDCDFIRPFLHSTADLRDISNVSFELCQLNITSSEFHSFIKRTRCKIITFDFCTTTFGSPLTRELFDHIDELDCLRVQGRSPSECYGTIDDFTLEKWCRQRIPPSHIDIHGFSTKLTLDGILKAIQIGLSKLTSNTQWNFGDCKGSVIDIIRSLQQQSPNQSSQYSIYLKYASKSRIAVRITPNSSKLLSESPLRAIEDLINSFETPHKSHFEICFTLPNCQI